MMARWCAAAPPARIAAVRPRRQRWNRRRCRDRSCQKIKTRPNHHNAPNTKRDANSKRVDPLYHAISLPKAVQRVLRRNKMVKAGKLEMVNVK
jgi:hypothetical protein